MNLHPVNLLVPDKTALALFVLSVITGSENRKKNTYMSIYYLHLQAKARTSEEMDGTLPRIASFENT